MCHACVIGQYASFNCARAFVVHFAELAVDFLFMKTCNQCLIYIFVFLKSCALRGRSNFPQINRAYFL